MKTELKKVKFYDELSEETPCFTAELHVDGKKVATVRNDGRGGCASVYFTEGCRSEPAQRLVKHIEENPIEVKYDWGTYKVSNVEDLADHLFDEWLRKKETKRRK